MFYSGVMFVYWRRWLLQVSHLFFKFNICFLTAPLNNMRIQTFKAQPTNAFFANVNQMFGGSPSFRLLPNARYSNQIVEHSSNNIIGSWEEPPNICLTVAKNAFVGWGSRGWKSFLPRPDTCLLVCTSVFLQSLGTKIYKKKVLYLKFRINRKIA